MLGPTGGSSSELVRSVAAYGVDDNGGPDANGGCGEGYRRGYFEFREEYRFHCRLHYCCGCGGRGSGAGTRGLGRDN